MAADVAAKRKQVLIGIAAVLVIAFALWRLTTGGSKQTPPGPGPAGVGGTGLEPYIAAGPSQKVTPITPTDFYRRIADHVQQAVADAAKNPWPPFPHSATAAAHNKARSAWRGRMMVQAYNAHGFHSPKWDALARDFLQKTVLRIEERPNDEALYKELQQEAKELVKAGCNDPWIAYNRIYLVASSDANATHETEHLLRTAVNGLEKSTYPHLFRFYALRRLSYVLHKQSSNQNVESTALWHEALKEFGLAAADSVVRDGGLRSYAMDFESILSMIQDQRDLDRVIKGIEQAKNPDPWAVALIKQRVDLIRVLQSPSPSPAGQKTTSTATAGEGPIGSPPAKNGAPGATAPKKGTTAGSSAQAESTAQHREALLKQAYTESKAAYHLHPEYPELATGLIQICQGLSRPKEARSWFYKAISAEIDYSPAYDAILVGALSPPSGSHAQALAFADACAASGRFETAVPHRYLDVLRLVSLSLGSQWRAIWRPAAVRTTLAAVCKGYEQAKNPGTSWPPERYRSVQVLAAWAAGRYQEARQLRKKLGHNFDLMAFPLSFPIARETSFKADLALGNGDFGKVWQQVCKDRDKGDYTQALADLPAKVSLTAQSAAPVVCIWQQLADLPLKLGTSTAPKLVRLLVRLHDQERLVLALAAARTPGKPLPAAIEQQARGELGDIGFGFLDTVPPPGLHGLKAVEAGLKSVNAEMKKIAVEQAIQPNTEAASELDTRAALARLRWLLAAEVVPQAVQQYVAKVIAPELGHVDQPGLVIDFMTEHLNPQHMSAVLAAQVGQMLLRIMEQQASAKYSVTAARLQMINTNDNAHLPEACWNAFWRSGSLRLALAAAGLLRQRGEFEAAALLEDKVELWLWQFYQATRQFGGGGAWNAMVTYNLVRGYEDEVLFYACHANLVQPLQSSYLMMADAWVRKARWDRAASSLLYANSLSPDQSEYHTVDGTYPSPQAYIRAILQQILQAKTLNPKLRTALEKTFPTIAATLVTPTQ